MDEIYKPIIGFPEYEVSNLGRVKSLKWGKERVLKGSPDSRGYLKVGICSQGNPKTKYIHELVSIAFLNHKPCGMELVVNHKDFNRKNNNADNLEIVTQRTNANQAHRQSSSRYTGVSLAKDSNKWRASIRINGKVKHLGYFVSEEEASDAYQKALSKILNK